jgi:signal transduction histidine kinase
LNKFVFKTKTRNGEIDYSKPEVTQYRRSNDDSTAISHDVVFTMLEDRKGTLWIGTMGGGLNKREVIKKEVNGKVIEIDIFRHYLNDPNNPTSLSDNNVSAIHETRNGDLWIGTSIGINKFNKKDGSCKVYTIKHGLPNNVVFGIQEDVNGNLWIGTLGGMSKFDPKKETFRNYGFEDGLQDNMFNPHAFLYSSDGEMFFGGPNGLTTFFPDSIKDNAYRPEVVITDFKVFNKSVSIGADENGNERLVQSISTSDEINLSHKDYVFSFEFSASNYASPMKNRFAYRMEGFDENWVYTDANNRTATYTNLDPGNYVFRVKAANGDGIWNEKGVAININIVPPFWQTLWFKALVALAVMGSLFLFYKIRIRIINRQKKELEVLVTERTKEIMLQKEEIQAQKENIEEKNVILEQQYQEIESGRVEIKDKNLKLEEYNLLLENKVKERTEQLRMAFDNLAETNKELDQFMYRSAHDLKGPLASIRGLCYLGTLETHDPKITGLLKKMESTTGELTNKLTRLMQIHEFNSVSLTIETIEYNELLNEVITEIGNSNDCRDVKIKLDIESEGKHRSDRTLIKTLLKNVLENSIKYKDETKTLHYVNIAVKSINGSAKISIADNGVGIPKDQADRVFDLFVIATENIKGFGIGLYEAKLIARRLKGNIKLQYPANGDTEFVITL